MRLDMDLYGINIEHKTYVCLTSTNHSDNTEIRSEMYDKSMCNVELRINLEQLRPFLPSAYISGSFSLLFVLASPMGSGKVQRLRAKATKSIFEMRN